MLILRWSEHGEIEKTDCFVKPVKQKNMPIMCAEVRLSALMVRNDDVLQNALKKPCYSFGNFDHALFNPCEDTMNTLASHMQQDPQLITMDEQQASAIIGLTPKTLQHRRYMRQPPTFLKVGRKIRYRLSDLQSYLESCAVQPDR